MRKDEGAGMMTAVASFDSMRRILEVVQNDAVLLPAIAKIMHPCIVHSLSTDGQSALEEGLASITFIIFFGHKVKPIGEDLWNLYPQLL